MASGHSRITNKRGNVLTLSYNINKPYRQVEYQEVMRLSSHGLIKYYDCYDENVSQETNNYDQGK